MSAVIVAPSVPSADVTRLGDEVRAADAAAADHLLVQAEPGSTTHLHRVLSWIRELGRKAGAVLDPASPPELVAGSAIFGAKDDRAATAAIRHSATAAA